MTRAQTLTGALLLGGVLTFGIVGTVREVLAGDFRYVRDQTYIAECGACHLAYPPQLLPETSWLALMARLDEHFGDNAELDDETADAIRKYLGTHALGKGKPSRMSQMMRNIPDEPPLRITEFPAFLDAHAVIKEQLDIERFDEGFLSPCADCHRQAASAIFDKELLHPGYGPSNWGGAPETATED